MSTTTPYRDPAPPGPGPTMFGHYQEAKHRKLPRWAAPLLTGAVIFHVALFLAMWIKTIWQLDQLDKPKSTIDLAVAPPPPPPPPPKGGAKPHDVQITPKKIKVKDIVQPVKIEKQEVKEVEDKGDPNGEEGGVEGGVVGGVVGGDLNGVMGAPPPPPPPPPAPPQNVPPTMLEGSRIAGDKNISPDDVTKTEIARSGKDRIIGSFKLCLTVQGTIASVKQLKSTGFPAYDNRILSTIQGSWRYKPYNVNGKAVPVCTAVTFIYNQTH
jgi:protein TonB